MSRVVYIAGPMSRLPNFNFPAFDTAAALGRALGWEALSPAEHDRECGFDETKNSMDGFDMDAAIKWDVEAICRADAIALLPGWEKSTGARAERTLAEWRKLLILDARTFEPFPKETVLQEAQRIVYGARQADYGHPFDDFSKTAALWAPILGVNVTPEQVALCMMQVKISRLLNSPGHRDSQVDIAGYAGTYALVRERREAA